MGKDLFSKHTALPAVLLCSALAFPPLGMGQVGAATAIAEQVRTVKGFVVDNSGEPVIGATVKVVGTANGAVTDLNGGFTLPRVAKDAVIEVSYVGYIPQRVSTAGKTDIRVTLQEDNKALDEVVVVGYGVQRKSDVTGALVHLDSKSLTAMPVKDALEGMQGKTAGVDITNSQRPGTVGRITIRGQRSIGASSAPLYVVDGMIIQNGGIENINPQDIESIEVLKDASATAIYGARGANGVVLVTTKKGKAGEVTLNYSGAVTISTLHDVTKMMDARQWLDYARRAAYNYGGYGDPNSEFAPDYASDQKLFGGEPASWANIDKAWVDGKYHPELVGSYDWTSHGKQTGVTNEHTLSASGGTDRFKGYGSFGYLGQKGVQPGQKYQRYTLNTSFEANPVDPLRLGFTMNASYGVQDYGYNYSKSVTGAGDYYSALNGMIPWTVPYDSDGKYIRNPWSYNVNIINPIDELNYNTNKRNDFRINGSAYAQVDFGKVWAPLDGLSYRLQFGPEFQYYRLGIANAAEGINGDGNNVAQYNPSNKVAWTLDNLIYYNKTVADNHRIGITLLQSASKYHYENGNIKANVASADELWWNTSSLSKPLQYTTGLTETQLASYMARINYTYADKYMLTASVRSDGASQLAPGHKWASFPSVALGWRVIEERFMQKAEWVSNLKLRLGYGVSGNYAVSAYATQGAVQSNVYTWGESTSVGYLPSDASAKNPNKMANLDLGWEKTRQWNVGLDFGFIGNRISGTVDYYHNKTTDLILATTIPSLSGYVSTFANVGETSGWGVDLQLNAIPVKTKDFTWNTSLTWTIDRNRVDKLNNGVEENVNDRLFVGEEIGVYYDYVYDGIWKSSEAEEAAKYGRKPGQIKVKDTDNNGKIDANDREIVGKVRPRWSGGWHNTLSYKSFELSFFIYARWKFTVPKGAETLGGMYAMRDLDYWVKGANEDAEYYSPGSNGQSADAYSSSMNYQDGSYIKMRNISLGYTFPKAIAGKLGMSNLKVYVQAINPFTIYKKCKWLDTDLMSYDNNTTTYGSGTTIRSWVIGLNIGF